MAVESVHLLCWSVRFGNIFETGENRVGEDKSFEREPNNNGVSKTYGWQSRKAAAQCTRAVGELSEDRVGRAGIPAQQIEAETGQYLGKRLAENQQGRLHSRHENQESEAVPAKTPGKDRDVLQPLFSSRVWVVLFVVFRRSEGLILRKQCAAGRHFQRRGSDESGERGKRFRRATTVSVAGKSHS